MAEKGKEKVKLFSVTIEDCEVQTFRSGGKGGQNQNKVESGVRVIHKASAARGEARDSRDQLQNKRAAFGRMARSKEFQAWLRNEIARSTGQPTVEQIVEQWMQEINLKIDVGLETRSAASENHLAC